jgi:DNA-binding CsgD family transcriptional regulator
MAQPLEIVKKIWEHYSPKQIINQDEQNKLALELSNRLIHFFQPGDFYYYLFNVSTTQFEFISPGIEKVLGYKPEDIDLDFFFDKFHPEDMKLYVNFENEVGKFLYSLPKEKMFKYKIRMDLRMRKSDGTYIRILYQNMVFDLTEDGHILRSFGAHTDISYLKMDGKPSLSFIGFDGEPSFIDVKVGDELIPVKEILSTREKEILLLIMNGMQNKEIAAHLHISKETVDKHRKNMLEKSGCKNSGELIAKAIRNGWV